MYKIKTPNPYYSGKTYDVIFNKGIGLTENENVKNILVNDFGYELVGETKKSEPKEVEIKEEISSKETSSEDKTEEKKSDKGKK